MLSLPTHVLALALACVVGITATPHPAPFANPDAATTTDSSTSQGTATSNSVSTSLNIASALPSCAEPAFLAAVKGSSCQATDVLCICSSARLFPSLMSAVQEACDPADQAAIVAFAGTWCGPSAVSDAEAALTGSMTSSGQNSSASMTTSMSYGSGGGGKNLTVAAAQSNGMNSTGGVSTKTTSSKAGTVVQSANETNNYSGAAMPQGTGSSFLAFAIAVLVMGCFFAEF
ncbi:hypothetical protein Tdes44962_MAKER01354 [Teratosphaeria destructans]|uniref:CFEM domain-containing protein n=1 Tax=Teratosphaeria destructans TaxID=418781 RepID=A0A9W7T020_9PEZI|nr:hypothetical protein Tdes44962_MAKER01354 [Teratosphaeria destructans]